MERKQKVRIMYNDSELHCFDNCKFDIDKKENIIVVKIVTIPSETANDNLYQGA